MSDREQMVLNALRAIPGKHYESYVEFIRESERNRFDWWLTQAAPRIAAALETAILSPHSLGYSRRYDEALEVLRAGA